MDKRLINLIAKLIQKAGIICKSKLNPSDSAFAKMIMRALAKSVFKLGGYFKIECIDKFGNLKWVMTDHNIFTNEGLDHVLDVVFSDGAQDTTHYVGLKGTGSVAAGDTMASHAGWTEVQTYSESVRQTWVEAGVSSQTITNSASPASFSINGVCTIAGAFISNDNTKGGSTGKLYCAVDFASSRTAANGDTLNVTYQLGAADDGA